MPDTFVYCNADSLSCKLNESDALSKIAHWKGLIMISHSCKTYKCHAGRFFAWVLKSCFEHVAIIKESKVQKIMPFELDENEGFERISWRERGEQEKKTELAHFKWRWNSRKLEPNNLVRRNLINETIDWHSLANFLSVLCERNFGTSTAANITYAVHTRIQKYI